MGIVPDVGVNIIGFHRCNGICDRLPSGFKDYRFFKYCSECTWWTDLEEKSRCVCCGQILRTATRSQTYEKRKAKEERPIPAYKLANDRDL